MIDRLLDFLTRHRRVALISALLSVVIPALYLPRLRIDNSLEVWLPRASADYARYKAFLKKYGSDEFVILGAAVNDPFAPDTLDRQRKLAQKLRDVPGVDRVWDLPDLADALWAGKPGWEHDAQSSPFLKNMVLGPDGKTIGMFVFLRDASGPDARRNIVGKIEDVLGGFSQPDFETHLAGTPRLNVALDRASEHDSRIFLPVAIAVCIVTLLIMLRSVAGVVAPMCAVGVSAAWTVGLMIMTGHMLNVVTVVMPTLHFVLGLSNGIRLASRYDTNLQRYGDADRAVRETLRELFLPLLFMSVTMAIGFLALLSSDLDPVVELGTFSAAGLMIAFFSNVLIVPGLLTLLRPHAKPGSPLSGATEAMPHHWSARSGVSIARHPWLALSIALVILAGCAALLPRLQAESNVLKFFPEESTVARDYAFIGTRLTGFYTVELDVTSPADRAYEVLDGIKRLDKKASTLAHVVRVDHLGKIDSLPKSAASAGRTKSGTSPLSGLSDRFYSEENDQVSFRVCILVNAMGSSEYFPLLDSIRDAVKRADFPPDANVSITGIVSLLNDAQGALVETQIKSFASAFGIIVVMMALLFRSIRAAAASVLPNLVPIMLTFGWMALRGIHLDAATVMIASVAIGIAVDNTIYFFARYRDEKRSGIASLVAVESTFNSIGRPITFTSIVAAAGFGILAFAQFQPLVYFGVLTAVTMLTALAGTLLLTPACVQIFRVWEKR